MRVRASERRRRRYYHCSFLPFVFPTCSSSSYGNIDLKMQLNVRVTLYSYYCRTQEMNCISLFLSECNEIHYFPRPSCSYSCALGVLLMESFFRYKKTTTIVGNCRENFQNFPSFQSMLLKQGLELYVLGNVQASK